MISIKVCGITKLEDARYAAHLGYSAVGFNFYPNSPRFIKPEQAKKIIGDLPPFIATVGVFVNEKPSMVREVCEFTKLSMVQLHGQESPEYCKSMPVRVIKAFGMDETFNFNILATYHDANVAAFLLDKHSPELVGGTGQTFDWSLAAHAREYGRIILAGGITPFNVESAIREAEPFGIDVNSGVEILPGEKNRVKMRELMEKVKRIKV
jgi:phosphoribosylanthranilate isomerase